MQSKPKVIVLGDVCSKIGSGATPRGGKESYLDVGPFSLIRSQNVLNSGFSRNGLAFISKEQAKALDGVAVEDSDVLLNITGDSVARVCLAPKSALPARVNQHVAIIRSRPDQLDPSFLRYFLLSPEQQSYLFMLASSGATRNALTKGMIEGLEVPAISIEEQRTIANALSSIDARIDHNRALTANLEAIAQQIFKSWFVNFAPVRSKAADEKPPGLADDIAALFPDRFVESELGEIPEGWITGKISDFSANVRVGCTPSQFSAEDFYVGLEHFDRRSLTLWNGGTGDDATSNKSRFAKGDLLFGKLRPYFHKVAIASMDGICSTDILVIRCADKAYREFMYFSLFQDDVIQFVSDASGGTRMPRTNWDTLGSYDCVVPPQSVASEFGEIVAPMIETMMQCVSENSVLTKLRDLLLPRLISGKLRVHDAETILSEAGAA
jgi:type I restriction enzyme S subunit